MHPFMVNRRESLLTTVALVLFVMVFVSLCVTSYTRKSATVDEPMNLTGGYVALKLGDYRVTPQNEYLTRLWCALPLLAMDGIKLDSDSRHLASGENWLFAHQFLYRDNDADALLYRARFMNVLLGAVLGIIVFGWARELFGLWPAVAALALYCTEPNILAHSGAVTSDLGFACFFTGTLYFLWRASRSGTVANWLFFIVCFVLALLAKYTGYLLAVMVLVLVCSRALQRGRASTGESQDRAEALYYKRALVALSIAALTSYLAIWALHGFRYAPTSSSETYLDFTQARFVASRCPNMAHFIRWVDQHHLMPNAYSQGFLLKFAEMQGQPAFLAGHHSETGWWYYFPLAFLIKTPIPLLGLSLVGLVLCGIRREKFLQNELVILAPLIIYLAVAMTGKTDVGVRYILPVYPLAILLAAKAAAELLQRNWSRVTLAILLAWQCVACVRIHPHYLAHFNEAVGGPHNGYRWLIDSNLDWGQDLKELKRWMDDNGATHINLAYFGSADPAYYGIECTHLEGSPPFAQEQIRKPRLPGLVAVSATHLQGVYLTSAERAKYQRLLARQPDAVIGHSIHVYWLDEDW